jgi:putative intracellular protease/amidase
MATAQLRSITRIARWTATVAVSIVAFALPLVQVVQSVPERAGLLPTSALAQQQLQPGTVDGSLPAPIAHDPTKRTALIVAGNMATESSDLLGPYETLAASGGFNVYVVAPERKLTPLIPVPHCCAPLDFMPHYSFADYDRQIGTVPDLVVVPYIPFAAPGGPDEAVLQWLRERSAETVILSICGGAQMVADSGILASHRATSHHITLPIVEQTHPEVEWVRGLRYVDDGRFISSAGVTSGIDATIYTLQRLLGRDAALATAQRIGYAHTRYLDDPTWFVPADDPTAVLANAFSTDRTQIGVVVHPGVREIELSSIIDTYPRTTVMDVHAIAPTREFVRTRYGLDLLPRFDLPSAPRLNRVLIPGQAEASLIQATTDWAGPRGRTVEQIHAGGAYPYDVVYQDLAQQQTPQIARYAARWIEYPVDRLALQGPSLQPLLVVRAVTLGLLSVGAVLAVGWVLGQVVGWARHLLARSRQSGTSNATAGTLS